MENRPYISVVIPVFNEEHFIGACLDALTAQTMQPDVIYVVDNNCADRSIAIARSYANTGIITQRQQGICASTQIGFDIAAEHNGLVLRCDADSRPSKDWIEKMVAYFTHNPSIAAVTGPGVVYETSLFKKHLFNLLYMKPYFFTVGLALGHPPLFGSNMAIRASVWNKIRNHTHLYSHQNIHDDVDISHHIANGAVVYDASIVMPISARPLNSLPKMITRYRMGFRTLFMHWSSNSPLTTYKTKLFNIKQKDFRKSL